jgi:hypothetical protein
MPDDLIAPSSPLGYPAPYWFLWGFKVLGFALHLLPMGLWAVGLPIALYLGTRRDGLARAFGRRLAIQMPVIIACGVNLGIVPLLFTQTAYYRAFYPATILMAWSWFSVFVFLTVAYYGVYIYAAGLRGQEAEMPRWRQAAGWISAFLFLGIGFVFSNAFSLMTRVSAWPGLWERNCIAGACTGTALNLSDPGLYPRWLLVLGLGWMTTGTYAAFDAAWWASGEGQDYRRWVSRLALRLHTIGIAWFLLAAAWYVFGTWAGDVREAASQSPVVILMIVAAVAPALPWWLLWKQRTEASRAASLAALLGQFLVLLLFAASRQVIQNLELARWFSVTGEPVHVEWSPLVLFLVLFVGGIGVLVWMVRKVVQAHRRVPAPGAEL